MAWNTANLFFLLSLLCVVFCSKYSEPINQGDKNPFRMAKVKLLWEKAQKVLKGPVLSDLYADLIVHDKKERDLKKIKTENADPDGLKEAETRQAFVDIISRYSLEKYFHDHIKDNVKAGGKPPIRDDSLKILWQKAVAEGFSDEELDKLREEFGHQQAKIDEYEALKTEYDQLHGKVDNTIEHLDDQEELWKGLSMKKKNLKDKHTQLRERLEMLERKSKGPQGREFKDTRVYHLWALAQRSNMTNEELESLKKELTHFEHRIKKHDILQNEVQKSQARLKEGDHEDHIKHEDLVNKVDDYGRKVEKYHAELKRKVDEALQHNEL